MPDRYVEYGPAQLARVVREERRFRTDATEGKDDTEESSDDE